MPMFDYINNQLCIKAESLYKDLGVMTYDSYLLNCKRKPKQFIRAINGGNGRQAYLYYEKLPYDLRTEIKALVNTDPYRIARRNALEEAMENDQHAVAYFREFQFDDGTPIVLEKQRKYTANANILNAITRYIARRNTSRGNRRRMSYWDEISPLVNGLDRTVHPHDLPTTPTTLQRKWERYREGGYQSLIHGGHRNKNTEKINEEWREWLVARYASNIEKLTVAQLFEEYNRRAAEAGIKLLKDEKTIRNFLYRPDVKEEWYGSRYGWLVSKSKYEYQHSTKLPTMRDSLWYSDGTKLNLYYMDEEGKVATTSVYEVIDTYSEVFLGYYVSDKEDFEAQFNAFKMAIQTSGNKPYEIRYDNQGGHKKLENGNFLRNLSHLCFTTKPYNGRSKTIESIFGRFQAQELHKAWFFTGMNIQSKKQESKAHIEFIMANKHRLPSREEAIAKYVELRTLWNNSAHPHTGTNRMAMYRASENPKAVKVDIMDMVELFWIQRKDTVKLTAYGLTFTEKKAKYTYVPYTHDRLPDVAWMRKNIDKDFVVRFDPADMSLIYLYENTPTGLRFVREMETKVEVHRGKQEQEAGEMKFILDVEAANKAAIITNRDKIEGILREHGHHPEQHGLVLPPIPGIETSRSAKKKLKARAAPSSVGTATKKASNLVPALDGDDEMDLYNII